MHDLNQELSEESELLVRQLTFKLISVCIRFEVHPIVL